VSDARPGGGQEMIVYRNLTAANTFTVVFRKSSHHSRLRAEVMGLQGSKIALLAPAVADRLTTAADWQGQNRRNGSVLGESRRYKL